MFESVMISKKEMGLLRKLERSAVLETDPNFQNKEKLRKSVVSVIKRHFRFSRGKRWHYLKEYVKLRNNVNIVREGLERFAFNWFEATSDEVKVANDREAMEYVAAVFCGNNSNFLNLGKYYQRLKYDFSQNLRNNPYREF